MRFQLLGWWRVVKEAIIAGAHVETLINSQDVNEIKLKYSSDKQLLENNFIMENTS